MNPMNQDQKNVPRTQSDSGDFSSLVNTQNVAGGGQLTGSPAGTAVTSGSGLNSGSDFVSVSTPVSTSVSSETGDIILSAGTKKKRKKGVVIGVAVVFVMMALIAGVFLVTGGRSVNPKRKFNELYEYAMSVKEENDDISNAFPELKNKYDAFKRSIEKDNTKQVEVWRDDTGRLDEYMSILERIIKPEDTIKKFINIYVDEGGDSLVEAIKEIEVEVNGDALVQLIKHAEVDYYIAMMGEYAMYWEAGCVNNDELDSECASEYYGGSFELNRQNTYVVRAKESMEALDIKKSIHRNFKKTLEEMKTKEMQ